MSAMRPSVRLKDADVARFAQVRRRVGGIRRNDPEQAVTEHAIPRFSQVNIVTADAESSLRFYRALGVRIPVDAIWKTRSGVHHVSAQAHSDAGGADLDIDSMEFAREFNEGWRDWKDLAGRVVIGFQAPTRADVDAIYERMMAAGYPGLQPPYDAVWGARYAVIEDPDGIAVGIMSPVCPELRSPPPNL
jgi:catechol 2,3-dioxygenase-like lactoylglutathione lyase family enzyme